MMKYTAPLLLAAVSYTTAQNLVDVAADNELTILLAALGATGQAEAFSGRDPLTVFAPSDAAFSALPDGVLDYLLRDTETLSVILGEHVLEGVTNSTELVEGMAGPTLGGGSLDVTLDPPAVNGIAIEQVDLVADNGIIHVIDGVIVPDGIEFPGDIPTVATELEVFGTLLAAVGAADLAETLSAPNGPFTVLAPTDDAFAAYEDILPALLDPENKDALTSILLYHVIDGAVTSDMLEDKSDVETLGGETVKVSVKRDKVEFNDATVSTADVQAINGVIHAIDSVLLPEGFDVDALVLPGGGDPSMGNSTVGIDPTGNSTIVDSEGDEETAGNGTAIDSESGDTGFISEDDTLGDDDSAAVSSRFGAAAAVMAMSIALVF